MTTGFKMDKHDYFINDWLIDESANALVNAHTGELRKLGEYQFRLLTVLVEHAGKVLSREDITNMVWVDRVIGSNSLPNAVHALRTALEDDGKTQRIIRTIPKRGYLLSAEYCHVQPRNNPAEDNQRLSFQSADLVGLQTDLIRADVATNAMQTADDSAEPPSSEVPEQEAPVATPGESHAEDSAMPAVPPAEIAAASVALAPHHSRQVRVKKSWLRSPLNLSVLFAAVVLVFLAGQTWWQERHDMHLHVNRSNEKAFSNIRLYGIEEPNMSGSRQDNLFARLQKTFYTLNSELSEKSASMSVYYQTLGQSLNYSFIVKGPCSQQQYVMVIHHWRVNTERLNDLILKETRREMHDLATCAKN